MNERISVLLVDDEPAVADLAALHLERIHDDITVEVETAVNEALSRFERDSDTIDCIVSDYTMPGMDGLEFLSAVRESHPDVPFVLFTGKGSEEIASEAIAAGVTDYLQKGIRTEQYELLANRIENAVEAHRTEKYAADLARITGVVADVQRELVRRTTRGEIEKHVCRCLAESTPYTLAWVGEPGSEHEFVARTRTGIGVEHGGDSTVLTDDTSRDRGTALHTVDVQVVGDIAEDARFEPHEATEHSGHESAIVLPLAYSGTDYGVLVIHSNRRDAFDATERDGLTELAGTVARAIHAAETRTRLERRERELREERAVAEGIFEALPDPVYAFDSAGRMLRWNDEFASVVEYSHEEIAGMNCLDFVPAEDHDLIRGRIEAVIEDGESVTIESALVTHSGESIPHEFSGARFTTGERVGIIGAGRDVTERTRREETIAALHEATRELVRAETKREVTTATAAAAEEILDFPITAVRSYDPETETLEPAAVADETATLLGERPTYARGEGVPWRAFRAGEPVVVDGDGSFTTVDGVPIRHRLYVPLGDHGTISIASLDDAFCDTDIRLTRVLASNAAVALDRVERATRLHRYERMLDTAGDSIYALDADGRFAAVNDTLVAETGYAREELLGEHVSAVLDTEDIEHGASLVRGLLSRGAFESNSDAYEITVHTANGDTIPCESQIALLRTDGEFEGTVGVVRDITARKRHEELLESLHDATREMMNAATQEEVAGVAVETAERVLDMPVNGVWLADESENVLRPVAYSTHGEELIGTPPTYATGEGLAWEVFDTGETRRYDHVEREANALNPETPIRSELIVPLSEYGIMTIGSTESDKFDESDVSLAKLLAANTEAALNRADREHRLAVEHDRLTALFENVPDAAVSYELVDGEPITRRVNSRFEAVFGYPTGAVIGESIDEYIVPPGGATEAREFNEMLMSGESLQTTVRRQTADGIRDFLLHVVPLELGERNVGGYSIYTDITDQKRRERELERQNELLDEFASVISHDLRNPLSVVRGRLELAHAEYPSDHYEEAMWATERMDALIEDVLTLARQGRVIGDTEQISVSSVAEAAWRTAGAETASLTVENPGTVEADAGRVQRLFENLFRNAMEHAGEEAHVTVGTVENGFFVADDGPGIPDGERGTVFEHGFSTTETGTGLGLTIVRSIADAHGWDVRATEGETGACFEIRT